MPQDDRRRRTRVAVALLGLGVLVALVGLVVVLVRNGDDAAPAPGSGSSPAGSAAAAGPTAGPGGPATGRYVCSLRSGRQIGSFTLTDATYRTRAGSGTWSWDAGTDAITFTGTDLSQFDGSYDRTNGAIDLVAKDRSVSLACSR
jgi:hypothetical protein